MPWMLTDLPCGVRDGSHAEGKRIRDASCGAVRVREPSVFMRVRGYPVRAASCAYLSVLIRMCASTSFHPSHPCSK